MYIHENIFLISFDSLFFYTIFLLLFIVWLFIPAVCLEFFYEWNVFCLVPFFRFNLSVWAEHTFFYQQNKCCWNLKLFFLFTLISFVNIYSQQTTRAFCYFFKEPNWYEKSEYTSFSVSIVQTFNKQQTGYCQLGIKRLLSFWMHVS